MKKLISILGSTGSVGLATLLIMNKKKGFFKPYIFIANKNFKLICQQIEKYKPSIFIINDQDTFLKVSKKFKTKNIKIVNSFKIRYYYICNSWDCRSFTNFKND